MARETTSHPQKLEKATHHLKLDYNTNGGSDSVWSQYDSDEDDHVMQIARSIYCDSQLETLPCRPVKLPVKLPDVG
jgi:hypothetical protein